MTVERVEMLMRYIIIRKYGKLIQFCDIPYFVVQHNKFATKLMLHRLLHIIIFPPCFCNRGNGKLVNQSSKHCNQTKQTLCDSIL
jgi:hypothetical protein